ncbi:MAG: hypothetical protein VR72_17415 [Clostridiaceae bacterium BRH_c20a]|nr:MAG: hypothetical protein VR72_17415 [Clostridiaceae bacterium BRH_c20a]
MSIPLVLGYLGPPGTFSEQAAHKFQSTYAIDALKSLPSIPHVLLGVDKQEVGLGLVPVENSIEGTVNVTLDMLANEVNLFIQGELVLEIKHCLLTLEGDKEKIRFIYSHPQALAQCRRFLLDNFPNASCIPMESTAQAALLVKESAGGGAALGSLSAAREYGLDVKNSDASDFPGNKTRFLVVGKKSFSFKTPEKSSLCLAVNENIPGVLHEILGEFAREQIDLTKIESRPTKRELGDYLFFLDCRADLLGEKKDVVERLKKICRFVKVLGCYGTDY